MYQFVDVASLEATDADKPNGHQHYDPSMQFDNVVGTNSALVPSSSSAAVKVTTGWTATHMNLIRYWTCIWLVSLARNQAHLVSCGFSWPVKPLSAREATAFDCAPASEWETANLRVARPRRPRLKPLILRKFDGLVLLHSRCSTAPGPL